MNCKICSLELTESFTTVHEDCTLCVYCNHEVGNDLIEKRLRESKTCTSSCKSKENIHSQECIDNTHYPIEIFHDYCRNMKLENDFKNKPVTITQEHLDMLNSANLLFRPKMDLSVETNQKESEFLSHKFIHEMTLEEKFVALKRLEAVAAMWSIALSKDKNRIQTKLAEQDRIKYKELQRDSDKLEFEKKREKKKDRNENNAPSDPTLSPEERQRWKAIQALMKVMKCSKEKAIETLGQKPN